MDLEYHYSGDPYKGKQFAKVKDPVFWNVNTVMVIDSILYYKNRAGEDCKFYKLKYHKDDILCHYYGEKQVELVDEWVGE